MNPELIFYLLPKSMRGCTTIKEYRKLPISVSFHPHQSVLLPAEDHLVMEVHVSKVLRYREAAQAVTRVVEVSGSGHATKNGVNHVHEGEENNT